MNCNHCGEPILEGELSGISNCHHVCMFRLMMGSVAHIEKRCSCYVPGSEENDPPEMTLREAARAALKAWERGQPNSWMECKGEVIE